MQIIYFNDTDTVHMKLTEKVPVETRGLDENIYIDIDATGDIVSMTIEHAKEKAISIIFHSNKSLLLQPKHSTYPIAILSCTDYYCRLITATSLHCSIILLCFHKQKFYSLIKTINRDIKAPLVLGEGYYGKSNAA